MSGITNNNSGGNSNSNPTPTPTPNPTTLRAVQAAYIPPHLRHKNKNSNGTNENNSNYSRRGIGITTTTSRQQQQQQQQQRPSTTAISSSISNSQSRWSNLDSSNDHNNHNDHNNSRRTSSGGNNGNNGNGGNSSSSSSSSRWSNVDRSSLTSSLSSSRGGGGGGNGHGHGQRSSYNNNNNRRISGSYNSTNTKNTTDNIQAIFFGDSFIKLFGLLNDFYDKQSLVRRNHHHHVIEVHKYKAASAKGLTRSQNENASHILKTISRINDINRLYPKLERLVFCFGSVDVHMSYYYKKYVQNDLNFNLDSLKQIAIDYIDFIVSLPINNNAVLKILIIGIYPSPLLDINVGVSLKAYGSLETQQQVEAVNQSTDCVMYNRLQRVLIFNNTLKERCHYYNNNLDESSSDGNGNGNGNGKDENTKSNSNSNRGNNCILEYYDVVNDILVIETNKKVNNDDHDNNDQDTDQDQVTTTTSTSTSTSTMSTSMSTTTMPMLSSSYTYTIKDIYRDVSDLNIHLIHETLLQLWITKWSWYKELTTVTTTTRENDDDDIGGRDRSKEDRQELPSLSFVEYLQETFLEYRKTKPWAKRKSIIEIDGIH